MISRNLPRVLSFLAHSTTAMTFSVTLYGLCFPDQSARYIASFLDRLEATEESLASIDESSASTAQATNRIASRMAERPRFEAVDRNVGWGSDTQPEDHRFQMKLENMTNQTISGLHIITSNGEGRLVANFTAAKIPPYETYTSMTVGIVDWICYGYESDGVFVTEYRKIEPTILPYIDQSGNASTRIYNHIDYEFRLEDERDEIHCGEDVYLRSIFVEMREEKA